MVQSQTTLDQRQPAEPREQIPAAFYDDVFTWIQTGDDSAFGRIDALVRSSQTPEAYEGAVRACFNPEQDISADERINQLLTLFASSETQPENPESRESRVLKLCEEARAFTRIDMDKGMNSPKVVGRGLLPVMSELIEATQALPQSVRDSTPIRDLLRRTNQELVGFLLIAKPPEVQKKEIERQIEILDGLLNSKPDNRVENSRPNGVADVVIPPAENAITTNLNPDAGNIETDKKLSDDDIVALSRANQINSAARPPVSVEPEYHQTTGKVTGANPITAAYKKFVRGPAEAGHLHHFGKAVQQIRNERLLYL